jgi:pyruvate dehydrogenase E2 component (dihydrolipoamide acetyltransferase)
VARDADEKNIVELSVEITKLAERARARKLSPDDMSGGTFTVSNLGGIGGTGFTPVVNWPELAILGTARSVTEPVYIEDTFRPRRMLPLTLSYDHRVVDGADGARFLRWVAESLEQPFLVFLEG